MSSARRAAVIMITIITPFTCTCITATTFPNTGKPPNRTRLNVFDTSYVWRKPIAGPDGGRWFVVKPQVCHQNNRNRKISPYPYPPTYTIHSACYNNRVAPACAGNGRGYVQQKPFYNEAGRSGDVPDSPGYTAAACHVMNGLRVYVFSTCRRRSVFRSYLRARIRRRPAAPCPRGSCGSSSGFWSRSPSSDGVCACWRRRVSRRPSAAFRVAARSAAAEAASAAVAARRAPGRDRGDSPCRWPSYASYGCSEVVQYAGPVSPRPRDRRGCVLGDVTTSTGSGTTANSNRATGDRGRVRATAAVGRHVWIRKRISYLYVRAHARRVHAWVRPGGEGIRTPTSVGPVPSAGLTHCKSSLGDASRRHRRRRLRTWRVNP